MRLNQMLRWRLIFFGSLVVNVGAAMAQTPSPVLLIASQGKTLNDNALLIVDPVAKKIVGRVPVGGTPQDVAVSPDGKFAFTTNIVSGSQWMNYPGVTKKTGDPNLIPTDTISVIDLLGQKLLRRVDVGPGAEPHGVTFRDGKVFFTAEGYKVVERYDPVSNRIDWIGGIGQNRVHQLVLTKDATKLFTANIGSDTVAALLPWDPAVDVQPYSKGHEPPPWNGTLIRVGKGPEGIAMSPDEKEVWVLNRADGSASIVDVETRKVTQTVGLKTKDPLRITFTPDGARALISDAASGEMLVLDRVTRKEIGRIANVGTQVHGIAVAPDGSLAYAAAQGSAEIVIIDMKTLEVTARIPTGTGTSPGVGMDGMAAWAQPR
jgi:YVTN family beta-propeller protein